MIIDCHGHYTTAPKQLQEFRDAQLAGSAPQLARISDDELRDSVETNQLRILRERGGDLMIFSPKASGMEHHVTDPSVAGAWARASNDLVARVADLYPDTFAGVCQLPQTPGGALDDVVAELRRCVEEREAGVRDRYRAGELGLDMNDMRPRLAAKGLTYVEQEPPR